MLRLFIISLILIQSSLLFVTCDDVENFCKSENIPVQEIKNGAKLPEFNDIMKFQINYERNEDAKNSTTEIVEYFDGIDDIGISETNFGALPLAGYGYVKTDELLLIDDNGCSVRKFSEDFEVTPFFVTKDLLGELKLSSLITLYFGDTLRSGWKYVGTDNKRGIDVDKWQMCYYDGISKISYNITMAFNQEKWSVASGSKYIIPIEAHFIMMNEKGEISNDVTSMTNFAYSLALSEDQFIPPPGYYCDGRTNLRPFPDIPQIFKYRVQKVQPEEDNSAGIIADERREYDYPKKLLRKDYVLDNSNMKTIHDFNTGLSYVINTDTNDCNILEISKYDDNFDEDAIYDGKIKMKGPTEYFSLGITNWQYVGARKVKEINCDVWSGQRMDENNRPEVVEWYYMAKNWILAETGGFAQNELVSIAVTNQNDKNQKATTYYFFNNFDHTLNDRFDFGITQCEQNFNHTHFAFSLSRDKSVSISDPRDFRTSLADSITSSAGVSMMRIGNFDARMRNDTIYVAFTLYEKSEFYGDVEPIQEITLNKAKENLNTAFKDSYIFTYNDGIFKSLNNSIQELGIYDSGIIVDTKKVPVKHGFTPLAITLVSVVVILFGLAVGLGLMFLHRAKTITLPLIDKLSRNNNN